MYCVAIVGVGFGMPVEFGMPVVVVQLALTVVVMWVELAVDNT